MNSEMWSKIEPLKDQFLQTVLVHMFGTGLNKIGENENKLEKYVKNIKLIVAWFIQKNNIHLDPKQIYVYYISL